MSTLTLSRRACFHSDLPSGFGIEVMFLADRALYQIEKLASGKETDEFFDHAIDKALEFFNLAAEGKKATDARSARVSSKAMARYCAITKILADWSKVEVYESLDSILQSFRALKLRERDAKDISLAKNFLLALKKLAVERKI